MENFHSGLDASHFLQLSTNQFFRVNGKECFSAVPFSSEFLSVNGTYFTQIAQLGTNLGLFGSKFLSVNGTVCSIIGHFIDCFVSNSATVS